MSLSLIVGPPNSGRAVAVGELLRDAISREPVLVVPTSDDAISFERRLCGDAGGSVGIAVRTFAWLVEDIGAASGAVTLPRLAPVQRRALVRRAAREAELQILARSARRPGFATALERLIGELQAALLAPGDLSGADEAGGYEAEIDNAFRRYVELRDEAGRDDTHSALRKVVAALRADPGSWGGRPVVLYGFDDLTEEQLEVVAALASGTDVTVAVNYADREALKARAELRGRLVEELGARIAEELPFDDSYTERRTLRHLDRNLFEPGAPAVDADPGLALLESGGERGEAEAVAAEIARLISSGVRPDEILVVLRHPDRHGPLFDRVMREAGVPAAVEASVPLAATATGRALITLARGSQPEGSAEDLLAHLRARPDTPAELADNLELRIRRERPASATEAVAGWRHPPRGMASLRETPEGAPRLRALAALARETAESVHRRQEPLAGERTRGVPLDPVELRAGAVAASRLEDLARLETLPGCSAPGLEEAIEHLEASGVPLWQGPTTGRVRVVGPYRARAARARHVFVAALQEAEFPGRRLAEPLLGEERRAAIGIPALRRRDPVDEERYLFHACVSRPTERLWLSWRSCDEEGAPYARSPFVDDVLELIAPTPEAAELELTRSRGLAHVVPELGEASSVRGLARSLAAIAGERGTAPALEALRSLELAEPDPDALADRLERAAERARRLPGPLRSPAVIGAIASRGAIGAGTLERWLECPFRWFAQHELGPRGLDPDPEPMRAGSIVHEALERLYGDPPGDDSLPRPEDVERWRRRAAVLLAELAEEHGFGDERPFTRVTLARAQAQIEAFLEREAACETPLRPALLEASFGDWEGAERPALELGPELRLHGMIDRVDTVAEGDRSLAVVYDYKTGRRVTAGAKLTEEGKLQPQLYAIAAREQWGLDPVGALYQPLGASDDPRPRGFALGGLDCTDELPLVGSDRCDREALDETLDDAERTARAAAGEMRRGEVDRRPLGGSCPTWCHYQPICRMERGRPVGNGGGS